MASVRYYSTADSGSTSTSFMTDVHPSFFQAPENHKELIWPTKISAQADEALGVNFASFAEVKRVDWDKIMTEVAEEEEEEERINP